MDDTQTSFSIVTNDSDTFSGSFQLNLSGVLLKMVKVKKGQFLMGSPDDEVGRTGDEKQHSVTLTQDYWLGETQVTQKQWIAIMGDNPSCFKQGDEFPMENVSWDNTMRFCEKLNQEFKEMLPKGYQFSLPSEAQWEYACRAETTTAFNNGKNLNYENWGPSLIIIGWSGEDLNLCSTHPVKKKTENTWGFYDMHGNVWEWCRDWYDLGYGCANKDTTDPQGPPLGCSRVCRGGSWHCQAQGCRSARRLYYLPSFCNNELGFRLALVPIFEDENSHK